MIIPHEVKQKPLEYIILGFILLTGVLLYFFGHFNSYGRQVVVYCLAINYFFWSIIHHHYRGDLSLSIIVEYLVMALFGITLLTLSLV